MPWKASDAKKFKKGLSTAQAKKWAAIANAVLKDTGDEAKAIRTANSRVSVKKKSKESLISPSGGRSSRQTISGTIFGGK